jgi:hypothetical protein
MNNGLSVPVLLALLAVLLVVVVLIVMSLRKSDPASVPAASRKSVGGPEPSIVESLVPAQTAGVTAGVAGLPRNLIEIDDFYGNELNAIELRVSDCGDIPGRSYEDVATEMVERISGRSRHHSYAKETAGTGNLVLIAASFADGAKSFTNAKAARALKDTFIRRTLRDMTEAEVGILRLADMLAAIGVIDAATLSSIRVPIVWNDGRCFFTSYGYDNAAQRAALKEGLAMLIGSHFGDASSSSERVQTALRTALSDGRHAAAYSHLFERYLFGGSRWLTPAEAAMTPPSASALRLGVFEGTNQDLYYDGIESLITVAPPGSGKSQAHVIRNLLHITTPAVVLDIKGEVYRATAEWRQQYVGAVKVFAPAHPQYSLHFNPLDGVSADPATAWDDARKLADLLVVPQVGGDAYFENRGRDLLTVAILDVALHEKGHRRTLALVLDRIYVNDKKFYDWLDRLHASGVPHLVRQAAAWRDMSPAQRDGIFDSARRHMEIWQSPAITQITDRSDWRPGDIRAQNATLYLYVRLEDVKKFASVLRVIIGQTVGALCSGEAEQSAPLVTFFLDELPRLGRMDVIEEALDTGRGFGVRLWMFCQNLGQLRTAYPNANGMVGSCAARCFMDPDDELAEDLSRYLGERKGLLDGRRKPLAEPVDLKGPAFADKILVLQRGKPAAKIVRRMAFQELAAQG